MITYASDSFNRADSATLGTSSGGQTWVLEIGGSSFNPGISTNRAVGSASGQSFAAITTGATAYVATVTITPNAGVGTVSDGLVFRGNDWNNGWRFGFLNSQLFLTKRVAGTPTDILASGSYSTDGSVSYLLGLTVDAANNITGSVNGTTVVTTNDAQFAANTTVGLSFRGSSSFADDFSVVDIVVPAAPLAQPRPLPLGMRTGRGGLLMRAFVPVLVPDAGVASISGAGAAIQAANTSAAAGAVSVDGIAADTQANNTISAAGANATSGSAADTQGANSTSGTGANLVSGSAADTQQPNTTSGAVAVSVSGTADATQALNTAAGAGQVAISGSAADIQQPNVSNGTASLADGSITGIAALTQAPNVSSGSGAVSVDGSAGITQQPNASDGEATTDRATGGAGEYPKKRRYVTKVNGQLVVIPDPSVLDLLHEEPVNVPVKEIKAKAKVYNLDKEMAALLKAEHYEQALKLHEDLQDEEDIEMLLLAL